MDTRSMVRLCSEGIDCCANKSKQWKQYKSHCKETRFQSSQENPVMRCFAVLNVE